MKNFLNKNFLENIPRNNLYFFFAIALTLSVLKIYWGEYSINEMWFDEGGNYYLAAVNLHSWHLMLRDDAGYLNSLPRLVSLILVKELDVDCYFPALFKIINTTLFCFATSLILLRQFDKYSGSSSFALFVRIAVLLLVTLYPHHDFGYPMNSSYGLIFPALYLASLMMEAQKTGWFKLAIFFLVSPIIFISKIVISTFSIPVFAIAAVINFRNRIYGNVALSLWIVACSVFQWAFHLIYHKDGFISKTLPDIVNMLIAIATTVNGTLGIASTGFIFKLFDNQAISFMLVSQALGVVIVVIIGFFINSMIKKKRYDIISAMLVLLVLLGVNSLSLVFNKNYPGTWDTLYKVEKYFLHRHFWNGYVASLLIFLLMLVNTQKFGKFINIPVVIVLILSAKFYNDINNYHCGKMMADNSANANTDLYSSDWANMCDKPVFKKIMPGSHYGAANYGYGRVLDKKMEVDFSKENNISIASSDCSDANVLVTLQIDGWPKDVKRISITLTNDQGTKFKLHPLYYSTKSRYYFFDLESSAKLCSLKTISIESISNVKRGWVDFGLY